MHRYSTHHPAIDVKWCLAKMELVILYLSSESDFQKKEIRVYETSKRIINQGRETNQFGKIKSINNHVTTSKYPSLRFTMPSTQSTSSSVFKGYVLLYSCALGVIPISSA